MVLQEVKATEDTALRAFLPKQSSLGFPALPQVADLTRPAPLTSPGSPGPPALCGDRRDLRSSPPAPAGLSVLDRLPPGATSRHPPGLPLRPGILSPPLSPGPGPGEVVPKGPSPGPACGLAVAQAFPALCQGQVRQPRGCSHQESVPKALCPAVTPVLKVRGSWRGTGAGRGQKWPLAQVGVTRTPGGAERGAGLPLA